MEKNNKKWFVSWFDTDFYHTLYKNRNDEEAQQFMDTLTSYLNVPEYGKTLDVACGKGRHSLYLNKLGYDVTGIDLSENSIEYAKQFENEHLHFHRHDMREPFEGKYDGIFNLFTSFGYFEDKNDNYKTVKSIIESLNETGLAVIDFLNAEYVKNNLVEREVKTIDGIEFHLHRFVENNVICKDIDFAHEGEEYHFEERVQALNLSDFEEYINKSGGYLLDVFGDYKLNKYNPEKSPRLLMIFK